MPFFCRLNSINVNDVVIAFLIAQFSFVLGFLLGRSLQNGQIINHDNSKLNSSFFRDTVEKKIRSVKIDDAKFVTKVSSDNFVKSNADIGKNLSVDDNLESSINKLAQLKKGK